ncbi:MAG TPA: putative DNA modification/repair radical SAM protein [Gemmatimonadaceae bacterium]|nr:putative DNA modification/repair radical SAM protein [Gemmatimonadaceae bacterium]
MDIESKLAILADAAKYDASCASSGSKGRTGGKKGLGSTDGIGICHSYTPDGRCVSLLKILLTNYCIYDCSYCINRRSSSVKRARFNVDEVVRITLDFYRRNYIEGLFLSSGIIQNSDYTMEHLVRVAKTLRVEHGFQGYIHLKTIPEASQELIDEAGRWADRLSINVELPTQKALDDLAPEKRLVTIRRSMNRIADRITESKSEAAALKERDVPIRRKPPVFARAGQSTQMIVGADASSDATILETASSLYTQHHLRRVYYSAFSPIPSASETLPPIAPPLLREHRLYQADWLVRFYGFEAKELTMPGSPNLDLAIDPKLSWALAHRDAFPVDLNRASKSALLRIPGLGVRNVRRILSIRRLHRVRLDDLVTLKVNVKRALPFVITADHNPHVFSLDALALRDRLSPRDAQIDLFGIRRSAISGEL